MTLFYSLEEENWNLRKSTEEFQFMIFGKAIDFLQLYPASLFGFPHVCRRKILSG